MVKSWLVQTFRRPSDLGINAGKSSLKQAKLIFFDAARRQHRGTVGFQCLSWSARSTFLISRFVDTEWWINQKICKSKDLKAYKQYL